MTVRLTPVAPPRLPPYHPLIAAPRLYTPILVPRMRRLLSALLAFVLLLSVTPSLHAQLGGLKKKVADKVTGKKDTVPVATGTTGKPRCDNSAVVITNDVVNRYIKALDARDAEIRKIAKEPGPVGQYYAAIQRRDSVEKRKHEFDRRRGPDWERYKVIYAKMAHGDQSAIAAQHAFSDSLDPTNVRIPSPAWEDQQKYNGRLDSVMLAASGIDPCDWNQLGERIPTFMRVLMQDRNAKDLQGAGTQQEAAAIRPRLDELANRLGYSGRAKDEMTEAEKAHVKAEDEKLAMSATVTGDAYTDCITQAQHEWTKKHQAEMDKVQKARNMAEMQAMSMRMSQETAKECEKYNKDKKDDDDE